MNHAHEVVYISGAITGVPNYEKIFANAEMVLKELGYIVINPCTTPLGLDYEDYMRVDSVFVSIADAICMLPNWKKSDGAKREKAQAEDERKRIILYSGIDTSAPRW